MSIDETTKRELAEMVDRWFSDDPGDTCFRTIKFVQPNDALRYVCDLLWARDVVVCQVVSAERVNALTTYFNLLVRCRWRAPWPGVDERAPDPNQLPLPRWVKRVTPV